MFVDVFVIVYMTEKKILKLQVTAILRLKGLVVRDVPGSAFFQHVLFVTGNCPGVTKWKKNSLSKLLRLEVFLYNLFIQVL